MPLAVHPRPQWPLSPRLLLPLKFLQLLPLPNRLCQPGKLLKARSLLIVLMLGLLAGGIAKLLMPGKDPGGCVITILLGIAGALVAGFLGKAVGWYDQNEGAGFIAAIVGAFLILLIYRLVLRRRG